MYIEGGSGAPWIIIGVDVNNNVCFLMILALILFLKVLYKVCTNSGKTVTNLNFIEYGSFK